MGVNKGLLKSKALVPFLKSISAEAVKVTNLSTTYLELILNFNKSLI